MGNRRNAMVAVSDDEDDHVQLSSRPTRDEGKANQRKRKKVRLDEEEEEEKANTEDESRDKRRTKRKVPENEEEEEEERGRGKRIKKLKKVEEEEEEPEPVKEEEEEEQQEDAKPIGEVIRVTGKGKGRKTHYESFEYDGNRYELEDPVLLVPEGQLQKPYVAIIKDITQTKDGNLMVTGQWFYRPEEAIKRAGGNWQSRDTRELFYSFHRDAVPAESVMHKCVVHFIPLNKEIPRRKEHPGFIVQKVYDTEQRRLFKLTDKDYEDTKQHEIDLLVQKTIARVGQLPDLETEDNSAGPVSQEDQLKSKRLLRKKSMMSLDVTRDDEAPSRSGQPRAETPGSCANNASEYFIILSNFRVLTGETQRDKWLEKLLQSIQYFCSPVDNVQTDGKAKGGSDAADLTGNTDSAKPVNESLDNGADGDVFRWPDSAVTAVVSLEKVAHEALSSDFQKYNQKMRQLTFNLKHTSLLARRLLKGELDPSQILNMSPNELKEALTAEELASKEPEEPEPIQMTDARCKRCTEKKVRLMEIIQAGHGDRYSLECIACGNTWYASRDEAASLTIDGPNSAKSVGAEPLATAKFEDVEKNLTSPRKGDKGANDILKKTTEAYMPVLDSQRSFNKTKPEDNTTTSHAD
ncbi:uncharacterized protein LOC107028621 isoform X1 [Solanum pennellii]|uniref:Uncharacterized protein LOC107028621 isoform X1 n=1 Tax=Solanum pennellii TaxID=28526 RepID=A0ABM1HGK4_SOLPN|nr:uncharacterized protein LOC107028621 isoform X1 [Solanum pennellii]